MATQADKITEIAVSVARIEERLDAHMTTISSRLDELKAAEAARNQRTEDLDERLGKVEGDVTFARRILAPLLAIGMPLSTWLIERTIK